MISSKVEVEKVKKKKKRPHYLVKDVEFYHIKAFHHTCTGRTTCALRVRGDVEAEAESAASLRHLEGEKRLEKVHAGPHARQHLIRLSYALQQPEPQTEGNAFRFNINKS